MDLICSYELYFFDNSLVKFVQAFWVHPVLLLLLLLVVVVVLVLVLVFSPWASLGRNHSPVK